MSLTRRNGVVVFLILPKAREHLKTSFFSLLIFATVLCADPEFIWRNPVAVNAGSTIPGPDTAFLAPIQLNEADISVVNWLNGTDLSPLLFSSFSNDILSWAPSPTPAVNSSGLQSAPLLFVFTP